VLSGDYCDAGSDDFFPFASLGTPLSIDPPVSPRLTLQDSFHPTVTVLEAVLFHAHMCLKIDVPLAAKLQRAREVISLAGLQGKENDHVGGRLPGGIMVRGLSGGEKRRLSLCCGIVEAPDVLFCDEPTSGT
jgi:ATP-binding cassette subfamily G (WHITE) protein 2